MTAPNDQISDSGRHRSRRVTPARRVFGTAGALLVVAGLVLLGNVAWQLWGTGIATARAQHRLSEQFNAAVQSHSAAPLAGSSGSSGEASSAATSSAGVDVLPATASSSPSVPLGNVVGHLVIPKIHVDYYVVEGVGSSQLAEGPGHYPGTSPIGGNGNTGIAGHRTTHGAPFYNLNGLQPGDLIYLTSPTGVSFTYRVDRQFVVAPSDAAVLNPMPSPTLTLTTCNPRYSATQRLIVQARLIAGG